MLTYVHIKTPVGTKHLKYFSSDLVFFCSSNDAHFTHRLSPVTCCMMLSRKLVAFKHVSMLLTVASFSLIMFTASSFCHVRCVLFVSMLSSLSQLCDSFPSSYFKLPASPLSNIIQLLYSLVWYVCVCIHVSYKPNFILQLFDNIIPSKDMMCIKLENTIAKTGIWQDFKQIYHVPVNATTNSAHSIRHGRLRMLNRIFIT